MKYACDNTGACYPETNRHLFVNVHGYWVDLAFYAIVLLFVRWMIVSVRNQARSEDINKV